MAGRSEFEYRQGEEFSPLHILLTGSEVHAISYPKDAIHVFERVKAVGT
jgi:hypothetical protein